MASNLVPLQIGNLLRPAEVISISPLPKQESKNLSFQDRINLTSRVDGSSGIPTNPKLSIHSILFLTPATLVLYRLEVNLYVLVVEHLIQISQYKSTNLSLLSLNSISDKNISMNLNDSFTGYILIFFYEIFGFLDEFTISEGSLS